MMSAGYSSIELNQRSGQVGAGIQNAQTGIIVSDKNIGRAHTDIACAAWCVIGVYFYGIRRIGDVDHPHAADAIIS